MAKKTTKAPAKKKPAGAGGARRFLESAAWAMAPKRLATLTLSLVWVGLLVGAAVGADPLKEHVSTLRAQPVTVAIEWPAVPSDPSRTWLPASEQRRLEHLVLSTVTRDVYDRESLEAARTALVSTGWFEHVSRVQRHAENRISVEGAWHAPVACVRWDGRDRLVAADATLLPLAYQPGGAGPRFPVIMRPRTGPPTDASGAVAPGVRWRGADVGAAIALAVELRRAFADLPSIGAQIAGIDASEFSAGGRLLIATDSGSRIVWGNAPGEQAPGEATTDEKIMRLVRLVGGPTGRIDAGQRRIDVSGPDTYIDLSRRGD